MTTSQKIMDLIEEHQYANAEKEIDDAYRNLEFDALKEILKQLRTKCMRLASNRATEFLPELQKVELLYKKVNTLSRSHRYQPFFHCFS